MTTPFLVFDEPGTKHWDYTASMPFIFHDGGRRAAGFKGSAGDCVCRAVAIASRLPYSDVYKALATGTGAMRAGKRGKQSASARNGIYTSRKWFKDQMQEWGFTWTPTMLIGSGCKVHLLAGELPPGRLVVAVSKHYSCVIDGIIYDTHNPTRATLHTINGKQSMSHRCVYGYWTFQS